MKLTSDVKQRKQRSQHNGPNPNNNYKTKKKFTGSYTEGNPDFPKEVEDIHKALYPVLKKAKRNQQRAYFNFDKLIIDGKIYRGQETKELPLYGNIL